MEYIHLTNIHNTNAAHEIVPFIINLLNPKSILDVGCGTGTWIKILNEYSDIEVIGIESPSIQLNNLIIPHSQILTHDLSQPFALNRMFDLIICLEVAEHLPPSTAQDFIKTLVNHSNTIIFSAAIPYQGGQNHLNERPVEYWFNLFRLQNFHVYDPFRSVFWDNPKVEWWYKQNMFLFSKTTLELPKYKHFYIHPDCFREKIEFLNNLVLKNNNFYNNLKQKLKELRSSITSKLKYSTK